ncbi:Fur family transcriptional regulator [Candidatus Omnitrophota bacterium]
MDNRDKSLTFFKLKCKENGLRITPQRTAIYQELADDYSHPSVDDVYKRISKKFPHISFDTVYRTLLSFVDMGIVKTAENYGKQKRFDPVADPHHHLYCVKCNGIIDFHNKEYDELKVPSRIMRKHIVLSKRVVLEGVCENCKKNQ